MKMTGDEAFALMSKWQAEAASVDVMFRGPDDRVVLAQFIGQISELTRDLIIIKQGEAQFMIALNLIEHFDYKDAREAPPDSVEWAEKNVEGCLNICGPDYAWVCSLFELRRS